MRSSRREFRPPPDSPSVCSGESTSPFLGEENKGRNSLSSPCKGEDASADMRERVGVKYSTCVLVTEQSARKKSSCSIEHEDFCSGDSRIASTAVRYIRALPARGWLRRNGGEVRRESRAPWPSPTDRES